MGAGIILGRGLPCLLVGLGLVTTASAQGQQLWTLESQGNWQCNVVSLGSGGNRVITQIGASSGAFKAFSSAPQDPPTPLMEVNLSGLAFNVMLDSADDADRHASMYQRPSAVSAGQWDSVVQGFDGNGCLWEYVLPNPTAIMPGSGVAISDDGQVIISALWEISTGRTTLTQHDPLTGNPTSLHELAPAGKLKNIALSGDGTTIAAASSIYLYIIDVPSGAILHSHLLYSEPSYGALDISGDGSLIGYGTTEKIRTWKRNGSAYSTSTTILPVGSAPLCLSISDDGSAMAAGLWFFDGTPLIDIRAYEVGSTVPTMVFQDPIPPGAVNGTLHIEICDDGSRLAAGLLGDDQHDLPEVLIFDSSSSSPVASFDRPGAILALDFSGDATKLAVVTNAAHSVDTGGPGSVDLYDISPSDFHYAGTPTLGSTLTFIQELGQSSYGRVLRADTLGTPFDYGTLGTLYLTRRQIRVLDVGSANGQGQMETPFTITGVQAGATLYFQGLAFGPRRLSESFVELTVLP